MSPNPWGSNLWVCRAGHLNVGWKRKACGTYVLDDRYSVRVRKCGRLVKQITSRAAHAAYALGGWNAVVEGFSNPW